jgi:ABC-2 type transport system ATP-binding protein
MLLEIRDVTKTYRGGTRANDRVSLSVGAGEVYGLLGHNGAGKTTLVNQVVGLVAPDSGSIALAGRDVLADPGFARRACSVQPQAQVPITGLTPRQAIDLVGRLRGERREVVRQRTADLAEALRIEEWIDTDGARLSGGVRRLVSFAMAAVAPGRIVVLDEPTNDVDPVRRRLLWAAVRRLAEEGSAVLLVTHNVVEAERSVDRLAILDRGRVVAEGTPAGLKVAVGDDLRLELAMDPTGSAPALPPFVTRPVHAGHRIVAMVPADAASAATAWAQAEQRAGRIDGFGLAAATLEDVYVALVDAADAGGRASTTALPPRMDAETIGEAAHVRAA